MTKLLKAFITGCPVAHSLSPIIHGYWLRLYGIEGHYEPIETNTREFPSFIKQIQEFGFLGGNVTLPHKETAFTLVNECDERARRIGAVNTIWIEKGILYGSNTDSYGFAQNLYDFFPEWERRKNALVLGAGGGCRAVLFALLERGYKQIILANRTRNRAKNLAEHFGEAIIVINWEELSSYVSGADLIVNTTSLGMIGQGKKQEWLDFFSRAKPEVIVNDIVYTPLETSFLQDAKAAGLKKTVDGIGMLLHQAVPGFERWFSVRPEVTKELRFRVLTYMGEKEE